MSDAMDWLRGYIALEGRILTVRISRGAGTYVNIIGKGHPPGMGWIVKTWAIRMYELNVNRKGKVVHWANDAVIAKQGTYRSWQQALRELKESDCIVCQCLGKITDEWAVAIKDRILHGDTETDVLAARDLEIAEEQREERYRARKAKELAERQKYGHAKYLGIWLDERQTHELNGI